MEATLIDGYMARAREIGKDGCSRDRLVKDLTDYAFDNDHGLPGVSIAINLADRLIASEEIRSSPEDVARAKENLSYMFAMQQKR